MEKTIATIALLYLALASTTFADGKKSPAPPGATVTLTSSQSEYFIGENALIDFILTNNGKEPFYIGWGGDSRGINRSLRYRFTVIDEKGNPLPNPFPDTERNSMGGKLGFSELKPGDVYQVTLPLLYYWIFDEPGIYTIRITHDFGWDEKNSTLPYGEIKLRLKKPTEADAGKIVQHIDQLPDSPPMSVGHYNGRNEALMKDFALWSALRDPSYLDPLLKLCQSRQPKYLQGIASIPTPEATLALVELAKDNQRHFANTAARYLLNRLPNLPASDKSPQRSKYPDGTMEYQKRIIDRSWDPALRNRIRELSWELISLNDSEAVFQGTQILEAVGTFDDISAVMEALRRTLPDTRAPRTSVKETDLYLYCPAENLLRTIRYFLAGGYATELPKDEIYNLLFLSRAWNDIKERPKEWWDKADKSASSPYFIEREYFLSSLPQPLPDSCVKYVLQGLNDPDCLVVRTACNVAGNSKRREFIPLLQNIQNHSQLGWLRQDAKEALEQISSKK
jgi:hypothetical protein